MFWKKKKQDDSWNAYDLKVKSANADVVAVQRVLESSTYDVIRKFRAVKLYPDGANKNKAQENLENAQNSLDEAVSIYNLAYQKYNEIVEEGRDKRNKTKNWKNNFFTSYELVEFYCTNK